MSYMTYNESVERFSNAMLAKLRSNAHKGHWRGLPAQYLFTRLAQEKKELSAAYKAGNKEAVVKEAADVATLL